MIEANSNSEGRLVMRFADGGSLVTDMIVFSAGIRPYDQLARDCGLIVGARGGIEIDKHCQTSDSAIFAIGECALFDGRIYGLVAPGYRMAEAAVSQLGSDRIDFQGADMSTKQGGGAAGTPGVLVDTCLGPDPPPPPSSGL